MDDGWRTGCRPCVESSRRYKDTEREGKEVTFWRIRMLIEGAFLALNRSRKVSSSMVAALASADPANEVPLDLSAWDSSFKGSKM